MSKGARMAQGSRYQDKPAGTGHRHGRGRTQAGSMWEQAGGGKRWKIRLQYAMGTSALTLTVLLALFLPDWYSKWMETQSMNHVVLEKREEVRLLDMEALDISTKLSMLEESSQFDCSVMYDLGISEFTAQDWKNFDERISEWSACHLLPDNLLSGDPAEYLANGMDAYVRIDAGVIPVRVLIRSADFGDALVVMILDQSNAFMYYIGIVSEEIREYMLESMGADTEEDLQKGISDGTYSLDGIRDFSWYDYASVCNADSQELVSSDFSGLYQCVKLKYEEFDVSAFRSILEGNFGSLGLQTMFGTQEWETLAQEIADMGGYLLYQLSPLEWLDNWNEMVLDEGRDDLLQIETETEAYAQEEFYKDYYKDYLDQYGIEPAEQAMDAQGEPAG